MVQTAPATQGENGGMFQKQDDIRVNDPLDPGRNNVRLKLPGCFVIYAAEINGVTEFGITRCVLRVAGCGLISHGA